MDEELSYGGESENRNAYVNEPAKMRLTQARRILVTHCSAKKDDSLMGTIRRVPPCVLYTAAPIRRFMDRCKALGVAWAIFSDHYGVWFPEERHEWYDKHPNRVSDTEFRALVTDSDAKLKDYAEINFYHNPGRFHRLYRRLLQATGLRDRIRLVSHLMDIEVNPRDGAANSSHGRLPDMRVPGQARGRRRGKIEDTLQERGAVCDDYLSELTGITPRQAVNQLCRHLEEQSRLIRTTNRCPRCQRHKIVNRVK